MTHLKSRRYPGGAEWEQYVSHTCPGCASEMLVVVQMTYEPRTLHYPGYECAEVVRGAQCAFCLNELSETQQRSIADRAWREVTKQKGART